MSQELPLDFEDTGGKPEQKPVPLRRIEFEQNWNHKLFCLNFTAIMPASCKFKTGERLDIRIGERFFCYATVSDVKSFKLSDIISSGYHLLDSGLETKEFMELMEETHSKKKWWNGMETIMRIVFLKKVIQLDMFESYE